VSYTKSLITVKQAAEMLGLSPKTVCRQGRYREAYESPTWKTGRSNDSAGGGGALTKTNVAGQLITANKLYSVDFLVRRFVWRKVRSTVSIARATSLGTANTPFSHLATVFGWTPRTSASCTWVIPKAARLAFSSLPFMRYASYMLMNTRSIRKVWQCFLTTLYNKYRIRGLRHPLSSGARISP
jgi:hypothetical protein